MTNNAPTPAKPGDWMENKQNLANGVHLLLAYSILLTTLVFADTHVAAYVQAGILVFFGIKEYWYDLKYETGEDFKSSTEDLFGYSVGSLFFWTTTALRIYVFHKTGH